MGDVGKQGSGIHGRHDTWDHGVFCFPELAMGSGVRSGRKI